MDDHLTGNCLTTQNLNKIKGQEDKVAKTKQDLDLNFAMLHDIWYFGQTTPTEKT